MDWLPWDLIFYGSMAMIFIGIMVGSAAARRKQRPTDSGGDSRGGGNGGGGEA